MQPVAAAPARARLPEIPAASVRSAVISILLPLALLFVAVLVQQIAAGTYRAEFSGEPDEAAHYMTGLMVHDYVRAGLPRHPVRFAEQYYIHYPKVALGHWPPFFYVIQAGWALLSSPAKISMLLLMAALAAGFAFLVFRTISERFGVLAGVVLTAVLVFSPAIAAALNMIMADVLVAALCLLAVIAYSRYMETGFARYSLAFGVYFALALLTKGSAVAVALVPPACIVAARRWSWLRRLSFWAPAGIVLVAYLPWHLYTRQMVENGLFVTGNRAAWAVTEAQRMTVMAVGMFGPAVFAAFLLGAGVTVLAPLIRREPADPLWTALAALVAGTFLLYISVTAGVEVRRLLVVAPAMLLFAAAGCQWLARRLAQPRVFTTAVALIAVVFVLTRQPFPGKESTRYAEAVRTLRSDMRGVNGPQPRWMVAADASGEGAFICEVAATERRPRTVVLRASKLLASALWSGDLYRTRYRSKGDILKVMDGFSVTHALVRDADVVGMPHVRDAAAALAASSDWTPVPLPIRTPADLRAYRRKGYESRPQSRIWLDMSYMLNRTIEQ